MKAINSSRQKIVEDIRKAIMTDYRDNELPQISSIESKEELYDRFSESLKIAGARVVVLDVSGLDNYLKDKYPEAIDFREKSVWKLYKGMQSTELAERTESVILSGKMGVAENGAVWIDDSCLPERLLPFVAVKLILLVSEESVVSDMHSAYAAINGSLSGFGVFISGPSKTADIEQSLVYGAHGAISLDVIILRG